MIERLDTSINSHQAQNTVSKVMEVEIKEEMTSMMNERMTLSNVLKPFMITKGRIQVAEVIGSKCHCNHKTEQAQNNRCHIVQHCISSLN